MCIRDSTEGANEKLHWAANKARVAGREAKTGADRLALEARIKAALANDVGLKSLSTVSVDVDGSVATLTGTVPAASEKERVEQTVSSVSGVSKVINRLRVQ